MEDSSLWRERACGVRWRWGGMWNWVKREGYFREKLEVEVGRLR